VHYLKPYENRLALISLAIISISLSLAQILKFGEVVHIDGVEYFSFSEQIHLHLSQGDFREAISTPMIAHWGGLLFGSIPFAFDANTLSAQKNSGVFFALPITLNVLLVYCIAIRLYQCNRRALIAAFLYTFSFSSIYQVRHVLPHDLALAFILSSYWLTLYSRKYSATFLCGILCFLCFFTYYGYWIASGTGLAFAAFYQSRNFPDLLKKSIILVTGFISPLLLFYFAGLAAGVDLSKQFLHFSNTIVQGDFSEGYLLPFRFFFQAEHFLSLIWLTCLILALIQITRTRKLNQSYFYPLAGAILIYAFFVIGSNIFEHFVVLGRLVKQLTPLLCLLSAYFLSQLSSKYLTILLMLVSLSFIYNYSTLYQTIFDGEIDYHLEHYRNTDKFAGTEIYEIHYCTGIKPEGCLSPPPECTVISTHKPHIGVPFFQYESITQLYRTHLREAAPLTLLLSCPSK